jgi:hypothetical protein
MCILKDKTMEKEEEGRRVTSYEITPTRAISTEEEDSVSAKAKETGQILKELVASIGRKSKAVAEQKTSELKEASKDDDIEASDAADIQMLGKHIESILQIFDQTMDEIGQEPYDEQQRLLVGFKKVLQEETNVINARLKMAKRLKLVEGGSSSAAAPQDVKSLEERKQERLAMNTADAEIVAPPIVDEPSEGAVLTEEKTLADLSRQEDQKA